MRRRARRTVFWGLALALALAGSAGLVLVLRASPSAQSRELAAARVAEPSSSPSSEPGERSEKRVEDWHQLRWIAAAGGATPEFNQVSIEQDVGLASEVFGGPGHVLFAAGARSPAVQVLDDVQRDPVRARLADLFAPRAGRDATYRPPQIRVDGPATGPELLDVLGRALSGGREPLTLYLAGHGHQGETPADNVVGLWGYTDLTLPDLGRVLDVAHRPVRMVVTTCFSGGFADLAFRFADPGGPGARPLRCGLFSAPWDLESSGCDPNPDRRAQEGFGLHFLHALRGEDRHGNRLPAARIDFDGDGEISLLEAHARVRIASEAPDVPTTTSERWLRAKAAELPAAPSPWSSPENDAVILALARRLELDGREAQAYPRLEALERKLETLGQEASRAAAEEERAYRAAMAEVLARWPVLDDPWHPQFAPTFEHHEDAIAEHLETSSSYASYLAARAAVDEVAQAMAQLRREAAPYERLTRALDNRDLAGRLRARGKANWAYHQALLECERYVPPVVPAP